MIGSQHLAKIVRMGLSLLTQFRHALTIDGIGVNPLIRAIMPITPMILICRSTPPIVAVHRQHTASHTFLTPVGLILKLELSREVQPLQPLREFFRSGLWFSPKPSLSTPTMILSDGHLFHDAPQIESIGVVAHDPLTQLGFPTGRIHHDLPKGPLTLLVVQVPVKDDTRTTHHIVLEQIVQVLVLFGEEGEKGLGW